MEGKQNKRGNINHILSLAERTDSYCALWTCLKRSCNVKSRDDVGRVLLRTLLLLLLSLFGRIARIATYCYTCRTFRGLCVCACVCLSVCLCVGHTGEQLCKYDWNDRDAWRRPKDHTTWYKLIRWTCTLTPLGEYDGLISVMATMRSEATINIAIATCYYQSST